MIDPTGVLMIEPRQPASPAPTIDYWTFMAALVYERAERSKYSYKGPHICICGAASDTYDHILPDGRITNSLAVHYVAYHRGEVEAPHTDELIKIRELFKRLFLGFDYTDFFDPETNQERQRQLVATIPAPGR